jgi:hypothetical protein
LLPALAGAFPSTIEIPGLENERDHTLHKTGETERRFLFFKVYQMAHYAPFEDRGDTPLKSPCPKAVQIEFARTLDGKKIRDEFLKTLRESVDAETWQSIETSAEAYAKPFAQGKTRKGDRFQVVWHPATSIYSSFNGETMAEIENTAFAEALWAIWTGTKAIVDREALLQDW